MRNAVRGGAASDMPALPRLTSFPRGRECRHTRGTQATADPLEGSEDAGDPHVGRLPVDERLDHRASSRCMKSERMRATTGPP